MLYGLLDLSLKGYMIAILILTQLTIATVTIFLHRCQSHKAVKLHPIASHFFRFWAWLTTGIKTKEWVAIHRKHHAKCETIEDPHSPKNWGLKTMLLRGAEVYRTAKTKETIEKYGVGTPDDWIEKHLYSKYDRLGIASMFVIDCLLFGVPGISIWALQMIWVPFWAGGMINGIGHSLGYRNFEPDDASTNIFPWGFWIGGEELHNNHHTFPASAKLSVKWWEFDMGWLYINILRMFGLAKVTRKTAFLQKTAEKQAIDFDVVKLIVNNRFLIQEEYSRHVIIPTLQFERQHTNDQTHIPQIADKLLTCSESLLDGNSRSIVCDLLERNVHLNLVYRFRQSLQHIWQDHRLDQQEGVQALKKWIEDAKKSGNVMLEKFAHNLLQYSVN